MSPSSPKPRSQSWWLWVVCVILLLAIGSTFRLVGTWEQGITTWDEGFYANVARGPRLALEWLGEHGFSQGLGAAYRYLQEMGVEFAAQESGHLALMMLSMLLLGISDFSALFPVIVCGLLSLGLTYLVAIRFFSIRTGIIALAFLAASPLHAAYSRNAIAQSDTILFFLGAFFFYLRSLPSDGPSTSSLQRRNLLLASILCGLALTMHPATISAAMGLFLCEILFFGMYHRQAKLLLGRSLLLGSLLLAPLLTVEAVAALARILAGFNVETSLGYFFRGGGAVADVRTSFSLVHLLYFPHVIMRFEGVFALGMSLLGIVSGCWAGLASKNPRILAVVVLVVWQCAFWSIAYLTLKAIMVVYPLLALAMGIGVDHLLSWSERRKLIPHGVANWVLVMIALVLVWGGGIRTVGLLEHKAGYRKVAQELASYISQKGGVYSLADTTFHLHPPLRFYLGQARAGLPADKQGNIVLTLDKPVSGDFLIVIQGEKIRDLDEGRARAMIKRLEPIIVVPHLQTPFRPTFSQHRGWGEGSPYRKPGDPPIDRPLRVYDLRQSPDHKPSQVNSKPH